MPNLTPTDMRVGNGVVNVHAVSVLRPQTVKLVAWGLLAAAICFAIYVRLRLAEFPLERDEGEFAYAGHLILHGEPPYKLAYNMKLPGTYLAYAGLMAVFGETTTGIHWGLLVVNVGTIILLYLLTRSLFDPFAAGMAAMSYAILSVGQAVLGMAAHATHFVAFFGLAGTYVLWRHLQNGRRSWALASGLLFGVAFLMKQQGVFLIVFGAGLLLLLGLRLGNYPKRRLPMALTLYSAGALLPYGLTCLWLWRAGVWERFAFWTIEYASNYVQNIPLSVAPMIFWPNLTNVIGANWPLWSLSLVGLAGVIFTRRRQPGVRALCLGLLAFSFLCVCPGFYFRQHYFIVWLPAVAMLAGIGCRTLWDWAVKWPASGAPAKPPKTTVHVVTSRSKGQDRKPMAAQTASSLTPFTILSGLVLAVAVLWAIFPQRAFLFSWSPQQACRLTYGANPFPEAPVIAEYLHKHTSPEQTIGVLGSEPEIFFYAQRDSATGYIYTYGLMERQPLARQMQEEMIREIESARPEFMVCVNIAVSWLPQNNERLIFQWAEKYLAANYRKVGVADILSSTCTEYRWESDAERYQPRSEANIIVLRRK